MKFHIYLDISTSHIYSLVMSTVFTIGIVSEGASFSIFSGAYSQILSLSEVIIFQLSLAKHSRIFFGNFSTI